MATPLTNIPLKTQHTGDNNDLHDPLVQDVLKEFEEEIAASKKITPQQPYQLPPQQHPMQHIAPTHQYPQQPSQIQQYPHQYPSQQYQTQQQNSSFFPKKNLIDANFGRKALIITILVLLLNYTQIFSFIYDRLPSNLNSISLAYDFYIKGTILFIALYILYLYEII